MKTLLLVAVLFLAMSCRHEAQQQIGLTGSDINLELLFEHDGCKVYRFIDGSNAVYWTDCSGQMENNWSTRSGKSTIHHQQQSVTTK